VAAAAEVVEAEAVAAFPAEAGFLVVAAARPAVVQAAVGELDRAINTLPETFINQANMKPSEFISRLDEKRIAAAIGEAERRSSGEICVYISHRKRRDALEFARARFEKLGMTKTRHRNAVLIYLAPLTRQFAVVGDTGVHEKCGDGFWHQVVSAMKPSLQAEKFTDAILDGIRKVSDLLAQFFPPEPGDKNEIADQIIRD